MNRRKFLQRVVGGTTVSLGLAKAGLTLAGSAVREIRDVTYQVKGFSCVTCAIGLEVTLLQFKGVIRAKANYPDAAIVIGFDPTVTSEEALQAVISGCGFSASSAQPKG